MREAIHLDRGPELRDLRGATLHRTGEIRAADADSRTVDLAFSSEIAMGRRPISFGHISQKVPPQERRNLILALFTERGASHLRARCARCDHTSDARAGRGRSLSIHSSTITHQLAW